MKKIMLGAIFFAMSSSIFAWNEAEFNAVKKFCEDYGNIAPYAQYCKDIKELIDNEEIFIGLGEDENLRNHAWNNANDVIGSIATLAPPTKPLKYAVLEMLNDAGHVKFKVPEVE